MTISRRKLISSLSTLLGISLIPSLAIAVPVEDLKIGKSINFPCRHLLQSRIDVLEEALYMLERGFEVYDINHGTSGNGQAKAVIDLFRNQKDSIKEICKNAQPDQLISFWVVINMTKRTSESGIRLLDDCGRLKNSTAQEFMNELKELQRSYLV